MRYFVLKLFLLTALFVPVFAQAQPIIPITPTTDTGAPAAVAAVRPEAAKLPVSYQDRVSLFFTPEELELMLQANRGFIEVVDPATQMMGPPNPGPRTLKLAGIVYNSNRDWTIWFNDQRVTPQTIPELALNMTVEKDKVQIRWLDRGTNRIINLTLRPHQQYHIDSDTLSVGTK